METTTFPKDVLAATTHPDPYPYYTRLVSETPFFFDGALAAWVAADAVHLEQLLLHPSTEVRPPEGIGTAMASELVRFNNGAHHANLRASIVARIAALSGGALEDAIAQTPHGTLNEFIERYPILALAGAMGIPRPKRITVVDYVAEGWPAAQRLMRDMDLSTADAGLFFQTYDGTRGLIGNTLLNLARNAQVLDLARREPNALDSVIEDTIRDDSPVHNTRRYVSADLRIGEAQLRAGDLVLLLIAAANRDPNATRVYTFGMGVHACPGRLIAQAISRAALQYIIENETNIASLAKGVVYKPALNVRIPLFDL